MLKLIEHLRAVRKRRSRMRKFAAAQAFSQDLDLQETFERIYAQAKWGKGPAGEPFWSGTGSRPEFTRRYEDFFVGYLERNPQITSMVDIGCGDFQVSRRILARVSRPLDYVGLDVVRPMIASHERQHANPTTKFRVCNAVADDLPRADLVVVRQVLQHLSNDQIRRVLEKIRASYRFAVITESLPVRMTAANLDIVHGIATRVALGSGVFVEQPPHALTVVEHLDTPHSADEFVRTSIVSLAGGAGG